MSRDRVSLKSEVLELAEKIVQLCREDEFEESAATPLREAKVAGQGASFNPIEKIESHRLRS
jgi:hypothetical protein